MGAPPDRGRREPPPPAVDITRQVNALFADPDVRRDLLQTAAELGVAGPDWCDERW